MNFRNNSFLKRDGNRLVGRYSNSRAIYVDVKRGLQGIYDDECLPCISPSGMRCAVNQKGHLTFAVHQWPLDAAKPVYWKTLNSEVGEWDNHHWSNHENYVIGCMGGKILNVVTGESWSANADSCDYPDLWIPNPPNEAVTPLSPIAHTAGR